MLGGGKYTVYMKTFCIFRKTSNTIKIMIAYYFNIKYLYLYSFGNNII